MIPSAAVSSSPIHQRRAYRGHMAQADTAGAEVDAVSGMGDLPQAFADEPAHVIGKRRRQNLLDHEQRGGRAANNGNSAWVLPFVVLTVVAVVAAYVLISHHEQAVLDRMKQDFVREEEVLAKNFDLNYTRLQEENKKLQNQIHMATVTENERLQKEGEHAHQLRQSLEKQIGRLTKYKHKMEKNIQLMSKTALLEKFGQGPHRVEIVVQFDPEFPKLEATDENVASIVIELAPVDELPHVVYWFLEQVHRGLYDGCSFHRNAPHVIQGGPTPNFLSPPNPQLSKRFMDAGFYSVLFQEYSPQFPHEKYTLGFAGRPGGPDFYISTEDNSALHGPGGQTSYEDPNEADPCFAKVVKGFDVVNRMHQSPVKPGGYDAMVRNVAILSMKILSKD